MTDEEKSAHLTKTILSMAGRIGHLEGALNIIAGHVQCVDNLLGNAEIARMVLCGHSRKQEHVDGSAKCLGCGETWPPVSEGLNDD